MNFVTADLVRDDGPAVTFAGYTLKVPPQVIDGKPGLADYFGRSVILGIRPSDFEDASLSTASSGTMRVTAGVTEELGSEIMVIFAIDARTWNTPASRRRRGGSLRGTAGPPRGASRVRPGTAAGRMGLGRRLEHL
jgi:hypothetical protein